MKLWRRNDTAPIYECFFKFTMHDKFVHMPKDKRRRLKVIESLLETQWSDARRIMTAELLDNTDG